MACKFKHQNTIFVIGNTLPFYFISKKSACCEIKPKQLLIRNWSFISTRGWGLLELKIAMRVEFSIIFLL